MPSLKSILQTGAVLATSTLLLGCASYRPKEKAQEPSSHSAGLVIVERDTQGGKGITGIYVPPVKEAGFPGRKYTPGSPGFEEAKKAIEHGGTIDVTK